MPRGVAILNHAGGLHHHAAGLHHHAAVLIAYHSAVLIVNHAAGCCYSQSCRRSTSSYSGVIVNHSAVFCFIMPRCYHAGGSALSCRWVLLFSIMPAVYIIMQRVHGSGSRSYCLSCRAVLNHHAARVYIIIQRCYCLSGSGVIVRAVLLYHSAVL